MNVYGRYAPSFSGIYSVNGDSHEFGPSFVSYLIFGGAVSYKTISLGVETRFGNGKFKMWTADEDNIDQNTSSIDDALTTSSRKKTMHSTRIYLSLRF